jgi:putative phosphoserine phosphatase / 1-acylglycerol-3-phosphate O-acyltransferase
MELSEAIELIEAGPAGPETGAFFDLDGTLVSGYTATTLFAERLRQREVPIDEFVRTLLANVDGTWFGGDPVRGAMMGFASLRGQHDDTLVELGERLFHQKIAGTVRAEARSLVRAHRRMGHTVAVASAASKYQIGPVARDLGIDHVICTRLEVEDGILTGRIDGKVLWGNQKGIAVRAFARAEGLRLVDCYAYGNGYEDVAFLSSVGHPRALNPHAGLRDAAAAHGWPVLVLREPARGGLRSAIRTLAALGGANVGVGVGLAVGAATLDVRQARNTAVALGCDGALRMAGVTVRTIGAQNLRQHRPAIFVANHQSALDPLVLGSLIRSDFTVIVKKEARYDPRAVLGRVLLDPAYVDRGNSAQARATLTALVARIRAGTSVLVFPEGTRSPTPVLGPFKKGAFHLAAQAGVPVVPVVLRNTGELMWRRSLTVAPGTVEVCVLDPVSGWDPETLDQQVADLREQFVRTLDEWPLGRGDRPEEG